MKQYKKWLLGVFVLFFIGVGIYLNFPTKEHVARKMLNFWYSMSHAQGTKLSKENDWYNYRYDILYSHELERYATEKGIMSFTSQSVLTIPNQYIDMGILEVSLYQFQLTHFEDDIYAYHAVAQMVYMDGHTESKEVSGRLRIIKAHWGWKVDGFLQKEGLL